MTYRTIFVATSGGTATGGALDLACILAKRFQANLEGFHAKTDPIRMIAAYSGDAFGAGPLTDQKLIDRLYAETEALAKRAKTVFEEALRRNGMPLAGGPEKVSSFSATWREETGKVPELVARRARFFDLVVLGASERIAERVHSDADEETIINCGRPVLLAPAKAPAAIGETIAIGWNGSAASVRSVSAALPLLKAARKISLITVGDRHEASGGLIVEYLGRHGITAAHRHVEAAVGQGPGEQLLAAAHGEGADLLVMGGYGHMPWREFLFGGATRQMLRSGLLPVLLAH